jgi:HEAT repeat protein
MPGPSNRKSKDTANPNSRITESTIKKWITELGSRDGMVRQHARGSLVAVRKPAIVHLAKLTRDRNEQVRWEAAKALGEIADPKTAAPLTCALEDEEFDVRWLAAEGLITLKNKGLPPLLKALIKRPQSVWLREGAHHILHDLSRTNLRKQVKALMEALEGVEPEIEVPPAAQNLLNSLRKR